jgi:hypothetical protein
VENNMVIPQKKKRKRKLPFIWKVHTQVHPKELLSGPHRHTCPLMFIVATTVSSGQVVETT